MVGWRYGGFVGNGGHRGFERRRVGGGFIGAANAGEATGGERRAVVRKREKKVWVAVEKKGEDCGGGDEDQAAMGAGYAGGDERDEQVDVDDDEQDDGDGDDPFDVAADHDLLAVVADGAGSEKPMEVEENSTETSPTLHAMKLFTLLSLSAARIAAGSTAAAAAAPASRNAAVEGGTPP